MTKRQMISENDLDNVTGGKITYTWDGSSGTIGLNGRNLYTLVNKDAFVAYYKTVQGTGVKDSQVLRYLLENGIAKADGN